MSLQQRNKRALVLLAAVVVGVVIFVFVTEQESQPEVVSAAGSIPAIEKRLARVRQLAAGVAGREQLLKQVSAELAQREKGVIQAETAAQAQAQLVDIVKRVGKAQPAPIEFGTVELGRQISQFGEDYGQVQVTVPFTCHIEDLLNFLADLGSQPEALATSDIRISSADAKQKTIRVRLTVAGIVPKRLVPEKKGLF